MTCKSCDECTAWNPFQLIEYCKVCGELQGPLSREWDEIVAILDSIDCDKDMRCNGKYADEIVRLFCDQNEQLRSDMMKKIECPTTSTGEYLDELSELKPLSREDVRRIVKENQCPTTSLEDSDHRMKNKENS